MRENHSTFLSQAINEANVDVAGGLAVCGCCVTLLGVSLDVPAAVPVVDGAAVCVLGTASRSRWACRSRCGGEKD